MRTRISQLLVAIVALGVPMTCALAQQARPGQLVSGCDSYKDWRSGVSTQAVGHMWGVRTFVTHPWLITSADGNKCLGAFVAGTPQTITLDEDQRATAKRTVGRADND
jgi:hypothetical protein